jgi:hypothetical protein
LVSTLVPLPGNSFIEVCLEALRLRVHLNIGLGGHATCGRYEDEIRKAIDQVSKVSETLVNNCQDVANASN